MAVTAVVYVNGDFTKQAVPRLPAVDLAIAADGGLRLANALGHRVDVLVGDLDSVDDDEVGAAREAGVRVDRHDPAKDETDLELAVQLALAAGADRLVVLGGAGGRLDHLAANLAVLAGPATGAVAVEAFVGTARVDIVRGERAIDGRPGMKVSLLAWGGPATGVSTAGLRWPLADAVLDTGSALGTSNEFVSDSATVTVGTGVVTAIVPDVSPIHPLAEVTP